MNKRATSLVTASLCYLLLAGCASQRTVQSEARSPSLSLYEDSKYAIELSSSAEKSRNFGPQEQSEASKSMRAALGQKGLVAAQDRSVADYLIRFDTYVETDPNTLAAAFPRREVTVRSRQTGINTPLGAVPTGRETYVTDRGYAATIGGEYLDRFFIIDVIDPNTQELLWRGYTRRGSERLTSERITDEIERIVAELPVEKRPAKQHDPLA